MSAEWGPRRARAAPRSECRGSSWCTGQSAPAAAAESQRPATARRLGGVRPRRARTTTALPAPEPRSRSAGSPAERVEVSPLVVHVERDAVVCRIRRIDLDRAIAGDERAQRLIDQCGIRKLRTALSRRGEQLLVDRRADPDTCYASVIPHTCPNPPMRPAAERPPHP